MTTSLDVRLRAAARAVRRPPPGDLRDRILAAIARTPAVTASPRPAPPIGSPWLRARLAAAAVVVAAVGTALCTAPAPHAARIARAESILPIVIGVDTGRLEAAVDRRAQAAPAWGTPLVREVRLMLADARGAAHSLLARLPMQPVRVQSRRVTDTVPTPPGVE